MTGLRFRAGRISAFEKIGARQYWASGAALGTLLVALAAAPPARAQDSVQNQDKAQNQDNASGQAGTSDDSAVAPALGPDQTAATSQTSPDADDGPIQSVVVTGTNISGVKEVGSEAVVLSRQDIEASGKTDVASVLRTLPLVQNTAGSFSAASSGAAGNAQGGSNATRGNAINLRGVGQGGTLTLVDGHRVTPSGTAGAFTEADQVPLAAIQRIEVIADGASAIYGSDAIAGVINYVLRKDYSGLEVGSSYTFGAYDNDEYRLHATGGLNWSTGMGHGNIIATYEYTHRDPYLRGLNPRLRADQRAYGGQDSRVVDNAATPGFAGNIVIPTADGLRNPNFPEGGSYDYYALPDNPTGAALSAGDLHQVDANCQGANCATYPNVVDRSNYEDYLGRIDRHQVAVLINQDIGPLSFYDQFFWTKTEQFTRTFLSGNQNTTATLYVDPSNPDYIAGLPNTVRSSLPGVFPAVQQPLAVQLNLLARMPDGSPRFGNQNPDESFNNTFGVKASLFADWHAEAYYTFGQDKSCGVCYLNNYISLENNSDAINLLYDPIGSVPSLAPGLQGALQNLIDLPASDPMHLDPFATSEFTQAQLDYMLSTNSQYAQNWSHDIVAKVDGTLFNAPAGPVKAAFGGEYYAGIQKLQNAANRPPDPGSIVTPDANARTVRKQYAAFGEVYVPVVSGDMNVPLMQELTLNGALRYDHYSDFGATTNPKISATWVVNDDFKLRGSWGTSFRAPGLPELNAGVFSLGIGYATTLPPGVTDIPNTNGQANTLLYIGNNPHLKAETGTNWQIGGDFTPRAIPGLKLSATYYNLVYQNKLGSAPDSSLFLTTAANRDLYSAYIVPIQNPAGCNNSDPSTFDPKLREFANFLYQVSAGVNPRNYCAIQVVLDGRGLSAAETKQQGIDLSLDYTRLTSAGRFSFNLNATHLFQNDAVLVAGAPAQSNLDEVGQPISWRGRGSLSWSKGPLSLSFFGNYVGSYRNNAPLTIAGVLQPETDVPAWVTFDLSASVAFPKMEERWAFMRGVRLGVSITNLFDNAPPIVNSALFGSSSIDLSAHNAWGRFMQVQLTKAF